MTTWQTVRDGLLAATPVAPLELGDVPETGVYAWWDLDGALAAHYPEDFPAVHPERPLYIGLAERQGLASRGLKMHLKRTRVSGLRRSLSALLRDELDLAPSVLPARGGMFGLAVDVEPRLTEWMLGHLLVTWVVHEAPGQVEPEIIADELPPLNYDHATRGPYAARMRLLRADLRTAGVT